MSLSIRRHLLAFSALLGANPAHAELVTKSTTWQGRTYSMAFSNHVPDLSLWELVPPGQSVESWNNMMTIIQTPGVAKHDFFFSQQQQVHMAGGKVLHTNPESGTLCFALADNKNVEVNAWKISTGMGGATWGNAVQWKLPATEESVKALNDRSGEFWTTCHAMDKGEWNMRFPLSR